MSLQPQNNQDFNFLKDSKEIIKSNTLAKFLVLGGAACSAINGFIGGLPFTGLVESIGIGTAAWIASQSLKHGQPMSSMTDQQLNKHLTKGAFLAIGGAVFSGLATSLLPGSLAHIAHYPTSILLSAGVISMAEAGYQKVKRPKI